MLTLEFFLGIEDGLGVSDVSPGFVVTRGTVFADVVVLFGIRPHGDLAVAAGALEVKSEDLDS